MQCHLAVLPINAISSLILSYVEGCRGRLKLNRTPWMFIHAQTRTNTNHSFVYGKNLLDLNKIVEILNTVGFTFSLPQSYRRLLSVISLKHVRGGAGLEEVIQALPHVAQPTRGSEVRSDGQPPE